MKEKFEIKPLEKKLKGKEPEPQPGIEMWEGEGGTVEKQEEMVSKVPETVVEEPRVERSWREILMQAKEEFPEDIQRIIEKGSQEGKLKQAEYHRLDHFAQLWFREVFGIKIKKNIISRVS